jgi:hypothetical protein
MAKARRFSDDPEILGPSTQMVVSYPRLPAKRRETEVPFAGIIRSRFNGSARLALRPLSLDLDALTPQTVWLPE